MLNIWFSASSEDFRAGWKWSDQELQLEWLLLLLFLTKHSLNIIQNEMFRTCSRARILALTFDGFEFEFFFFYVTHHFECINLGILKWDCLNKMLNLLFSWHFASKTHCVWFYSELSSSASLTLANTFVNLSLGEEIFVSIWMGRQLDDIKIIIMFVE